MSFPGRCVCSADVLRLDRFADPRGKKDDTEPMWATAAVIAARYDGPSRLETLLQVQPVSTSSQKAQKARKKEKIFFPFFLPSVLFETK